MILSKILFHFGTNYRNPSLKRFYKELLDTDRAPLSELIKIQENKFQILMDYTFSYSPYYISKFREFGIQRGDIKSLDDLKIIPTLDKSELRLNADSINSTYNFSKIIVSETSGTSGQPLKFNKDEEWDSMNRASMYRGYSWFGVKPWEKNGYFWGYNIERKDRNRIKLLDWLQNRFRLFSYDDREIIRFMKKLVDANYLEGYSSMIYEVAKKINSIEKISKPKHIKLIKGTSEKIYDNYHIETIRAFGSKIRSEYGAAEAGLIAFECPVGYMHINSENVVVEEEGGEIIVTNLMSKSFPIIRYKLGDKITLASSDFRCKCGREHPVILDVLGRVGKNIIGKLSSYPSLTFYYVFKNLALNYNITLNYQAVQNAPGEILLKIEQNAFETERQIKDELDKYFKNDIDFKIIFNAKLHEMDGKLRDFITTLE